MPDPNHPVSFTTVDPPAQTTILPLVPNSLTSVDTASWSRTQPLQWSSQVLDFQGNPARPIQIPPIRVFAEGRPDAIDVGVQIARLRSLLYVPEAQTQLGGLSRPRRVLFHWPNLYRGIVVLLQMTVTRLRFSFSDDLAVRGSANGWSIQIRMVEFNGQTRRTSQLVESGQDGFGGEIGNASTNDPTVTALLSV